MEDKTYKKEGMTALGWIVLTCLFLVILYIPTELTLRAIQGQEFNGVLDNAVSSAIAQIEEDSIRAGETNIDSSRAEKAFFDVLSESYNLEYSEMNDGGNTKLVFIEDSFENSKLTDIEVEFQVIPFSRRELQENVIKDSAPFSDGSVYEGISSSSVVVRVKATYPRMLLTMMDEAGFTFDRMSAAQVQLQN